VLEPARLVAVTPFDDRQEQPLLGSEVVKDADVADADLLRQAEDARSAEALTGEEANRGIEDRLAAGDPSCLGPAGSAWGTIDTAFGTTVPANAAFCCLARQG
jgi:hypothetical protein